MKSTICVNRNCFTIESSSDAALSAKLMRLLMPLSKISPKFLRTFKGPSRMDVSPRSFHAVTNSSRMLATMPPNVSSCWSIHAAALSIAPISSSFCFNKLPPGIISSAAFIKFLPLRSMCSPVIGSCPITTPSAV